MTSRAVGHRVALWVLSGPAAITAAMSPSGNPPILPGLWGGVRYVRLSCVPEGRFGSVERRNDHVKD